MRKLFWIPLAMVAGGGAAFAAEQTANRFGMSDAEQVRFDKTLAGRVPGDPVICVNTRDLEGNQGFGQGVLLFKSKVNGNPIYLNAPAGGCARFSKSSAIRFQIPTTRLCTGDIVEVFEPTSGISQGSCGLGEFVPYRKPK